MTNQYQPLWEVMRNAYDSSSVPTELIESCDPQTGDCLTDRFGYAAELRAIADVVAPEEPEPVNGDSNDWGRYDARLAVRELLLAEADRAEEGK